MDRGTLLMVVITVGVDNSLVDVGKSIAILQVGLLTPEQLDVATFVCANHKTFHKEDAGLGEVNDNARVKTLAKKLEVRIRNERSTTVQPSPTCAELRAPCWTKSIEWKVASLSSWQTGTTTRVQMQTSQLVIDALDAHAAHPPADSLRKMKKTPCRIVGWSTCRNLTRHDVEINLDEDDDGTKDEEKWKGKER